MTTYRIENAAELAAAVRALRKEAGFTQQAVAKTAATKQATVSVFENTPEKAQLETFLKIAAALRLTITIGNKDTAEAATLTEAQVASQTAKPAATDTKAKTQPQQNRETLQKVSKKERCHTPADFYEW